MLKDILSKNFFLVSKVLRNTSAEKWEEKSIDAALGTANFAIRSVTGYKKFLNENKISIKKVKDIKLFKTLPLSDKEKYIKKCSINEISNVSAGKDLYSFSLSSGTTDTPSLWPRYLNQEDSYPLIAEIFMRQYWNINKKSTLVINAFNMGVYASGMQIHSALRPLTKKYKLTLATTGSEIENIIHSIKILSKYYDQIAIFSYPTFLRTVVDKIIDAGIDINKLNLKLFLTGEPSSVAWRRYMNKLLTGDPDNLTSIIDVYSSTETGLVGLGTPLCNLIRGICESDPQLRLEVFGSKDSSPNIVQYNTLNQYLECVDGNLVITSRSGTPLVRYNIHDRGGIIDFKSMERILLKHGYDYQKLLHSKNVNNNSLWKMPFVYCYGRSQDMVIVGGGNVFPEQIEPLIINEEQQLAHSFKMRMVCDEDQHQVFKIFIELKSTVKLNNDKKEILAKKYHDIVFNFLLSTNADYAIAYKSDPEFSDVVTEVFDFGTGIFSEDKNRTKPKLVIKN